MVVTCQGHADYALWKTVCANVFMEAEDTTGKGSTSVALPRQAWRLALMLRPLLCCHCGVARMGLQYDGCSISIHATLVWHLNRVLLLDTISSWAKRLP